MPNTNLESYFNLNHKFKKIKKNIIVIHYKIKNIDYYNIKFRVYFNLNHPVALFPSQSQSAPPKSSSLKIRKKKKKKTPQPALSSLRTLPAATCLVTEPHQN
jgi:hypothetical protein